MNDLHFAAAEPRPRPRYEPRKAGGGMMTFLVVVLLVLVVVQVRTCYLLEKIAHGTWTVRQSR